MKKRWLLAVLFVGGAYALEPPPLTPHGAKLPAEGYNNQSRRLNLHSPAPTLRGGASMPPAPLSTGATLRILLPPSELKAIKEKLELRNKELEAKLQSLKANLKVQSAQVKLMLTRAELNLTLAKLYLKKIEELEKMKNLSPLPVEGVVGNLVITDKGVIRSGTELFGEKIEVKNGLVYVGGKPANLFAKNLADWINRVNALEGQAQQILSQVSQQVGQSLTPTTTTYGLSSGETFNVPQNTQGGGQ